MTYIFFAILGFCNFFQVAYFFWRFLLYRKPPSLICAIMPLGWIVATARELRWLPQSFTAVILASGMVVGVFGMVVILNHETQQKRPFR